MVTTVVVEGRPRGKEDSERRSRSTQASRTQASPTQSKPITRPAESHSELSDSERSRQISLCAYYKAEQRGFAPGHMWDDWLAAEREVLAKNAQKLGERHGSKS